MPVNKFYTYYQAITPIEAEQFTLLSKISLLTKMKQGAINSWFSFLKKQVHSTGDARAMTLRQLAGKLSKGVPNGGR